MYKSIQKFVEKGTQEIEKSSKEFYEELNLDRLIVKTEEIVRELGRKLIEETLENLNERLRHSKDRKKNWYIKHKCLLYLVFSYGIVASFSRKFPELNSTGGFSFSH